MWKALAVAGLVMAGSAMAGEEVRAVSIVKEWKGTYAAQAAPKQIVVRDRKGWEEVWSGMNGKIAPMPPIEAVDFGSHMVIAVFMGTRTKGGYAVKIAGIEEHGTLIVKVRESAPPPGAMVTMALTAPYHVVVVPRSDKPVEFVAEK